MLTIETHDDGERFWREIGEPLSARPVANNVFVGVANRIRADVSKELLRLGVFEGGRLVLGALRTPPFRLKLADFGDGDDAAAALAARLSERGVELPGVFGDVRLADRFAQTWCAVTGERIEEAHGRRQNLYQIEHVTPPAVDGRMRPAIAAERNLVIEWELGFAEDAGLGPAERDRAFVTQLVDEGLADNTFALWEVDSAPVSTARVRRIAGIGARVSGVYTPPHLRGRGFASALTAALSQKVLDSGKWCCLFADAAQPAHQSDLSTDRISEGCRLRRHLIRWSMRLQ